jgi:hypothetical protein
MWVPVGLAALVWAWQKRVRFPIISSPSLMEPMRRMSRRTEQ